MASREQPFRIAILGAGPAGLLLTRIVATVAKPATNFTITLFERDTSPTSPLYRPQGGSLDLHASSGQLAIREAGLWDEFMKCARYDAQDSKTANKAGEILMQLGEELDRPEIGRGQLRDVLLKGFDDLDKDRINLLWGQQIVKYETARAVSSRLL